MSKTFLLTGLITAAFASGALAHPPGALAPDNEPITREMALQRADSLFEQLDMNHDGLLTPREVLLAGGKLRAERASTGVDVAPGIGGQTARYMKRRFAGARSISREQFEAGMLAHFDEMDRDHDGVLTAAERAQPQ